MNDISIRTLTTPEELTLVKNLESVVWAEDDPIPVHQSIAVVKNGGMVIGAFIGTRLIGYQYSFPGFHGSKVYLCSHAMGIHPDFRRRGIGEQLKLKQRIEALKMGYDLIVWTYDPLETVNGYLNLSKLGGVCKTYIENYYGDMPDILNAGMPSDRFLVEWHIKEPLPSQRGIHKHRDIPSLIHVGMDEHGIAIPKSVNLDFQDDMLSVVVPGNIQEIKLENMELALAWRMKTREVFTYYLNKGWIVTELRKHDHPSFFTYILRKSE